MKLRRTAVLTILLGLLGLVGPATLALDSNGIGERSAEARSRKRDDGPRKGKDKSKKKSRRAAMSKSERASNKNRSKVKICSEKKGKRRCTYQREFQGHGVARDELRADGLERPSGDIWVMSNSVNDEAKVNIYAAAGGFDDASLARLDEIFMCRRSGEIRSVDPRLYEMLSRVYDHFGQQKIELVSGFRFVERDSSRHHHASAMDIRIKGVSTREMYAFAQTLDVGGMGIGIYPESGFVHVDFRAPGEPSYRWTDHSGASRDTKKSKSSRPRTTRAKKPTS